MLQMIVGRSGSGKTHEVQHRLCTLVEQGKEKLMVIVPEQLSFETEKAFLNLLGPIKSRNIEVLSFTRMVDFVFRQTGGLSGRVIDDGGRNILMSLAIEQAQDQLELYQKQVQSPELVTLMLTAVKEFKMCCISTDTLRQASTKTDNPTLKQKLKETAIITDIYNVLLEKSYIDPLDHLSKMRDILASEPLFAGYTVFVDSFSGFTAAEQQVLEQIIKQCDLCGVTICTDEQEYREKSQRFTTTNETKRMLTKLAKKNSAAVLAPVYLTENYRTTSTAIKAVEAQLYRPNSTPIKQETEDVFLYAAKDIYGECNFIAREIKRLVIEQNYRYKDIAVVCRQEDKYRGILDATLERFGIHYFMDQPQDITSKPLITFVFSAFEVVHNNFATDSILRFLKSGLTGITAEEIALLENYVFVWSIERLSWLSPFTANPRGYAEAFTQADHEELQTVEALRQSIISPLKQFKFAVAKTNGKNISMAVYKLLQAFGVEETIKGQTATLQTEGKLEQAKELVRIWDIFIAALDQTAMLLAEWNMTSKRYLELLRAVVVSQDIAFIPRGLDQVTVGTADRVRLNSPKATFVIGAVEGEFPSVPVVAGIFSDIERCYLISMDLPMYDALENLSAMEQFYAYSAVSSCTDRLYLSCYELSLAGDIQYPSSLIQEVQTILPAVPLVYQRQENAFNHLWAEKQAFTIAARHWNEEQNVNAVQLKTYFKEKEAYKGVIRALELYSSNKPAQIENRALAKKLFGEEMNISASQVEKFYLCSFQYFCRYGIKAKERKKAQIDSAEYGSLIHYLLEQMLKNDTIEALNAMTGEELAARIQEEMEQYLQTYLGGEEDKSSRYLQSYLRIKDTAVLLVSHIIKELSQSKFRPVDFELDIGKDIPPYRLDLSDGGRVVIQGFVDRVDIYQADNTAKIRIIDYKTGSKKFMLSDIAFGLNLQMLLYLSAIVKNGKDRYKMPVTPAGVLYMPAKEAYIPIEPDTTKEVQEALRKKEYRMNGLVLNDVETVKAMEEQGKGEYIPVSLKAEKLKKGEEVPPEGPRLAIGSGAQYTVSMEQMQSIFDKIDNYIAQMAQNLLAGKISAVPAKGEYDACKWCPYLHLCGYKEGMECVEVTKDASPFRKNQIAEEGN